MSTINLTVDAINQLAPNQIAEDDRVKAKFVEIYEAMWTPTTGITGEAAYQRESRNFNRLIGEKEDLRKKCTRFSLFTAFLDVAISGLSLDPGSRAQAYLLSRSVAVDSNYVNGQKVSNYETHCVLTISGYGELVLRARCGQIRHADNPVIVYAEDAFEYGEHNGNKFVNYTCRLPHTSGNIVACFMKITRADGSVDYSVMLPEDWSRLAGYSARNNARWDKTKGQWTNLKPNDLYGMQQDGTCKIDPGFLTTKLIKHAFKSYPKARVGRGTQLESQQVDEIEVNDNLYGLQDGSTVNTSTGEVTTPAKDNGFAPASDTSAGITINTDDDDLF